MTLNRYSYQGAETRLVAESAYGVTPGTPTWKRLNGIGLRLSPSVTVNPFAAPGQLVPAIPLVDDDFTEGSVEGRVDFNAIGYILAGLFGYPTITSLGGAPTAYQWDWSWNGRRPNRPASFAAYYGYPDSADFCNGLIFNTMGISGGRGDGFDVSGDVFAKSMTAGQTLGGITNELQTVTITGTPTGGTFTLTLDGFTTATIAYNATAAAVQTALEALPNLEVGDVTVGGGPGPGTPYTVTFTGSLGGVNVSQMTAAHAFTGGASPNISVATTTPGTDAVSDVPAVPAGAVLGDVYLDTTWAGLGTTQLLECYGMDLSIGERMSRTMPINKSKSSDGVIDVGDQEHTLTLTLAKNAVSDAQLAKLKAGTRSFARVQWTGDVISGANNYGLRIDSSLFYQSIGNADDNDNVFVRDYEGRLAIDPVSSNVLAIRLTNATASL